MTSEFDKQRALHQANPLLNPLGPYIESRPGWIKVLNHDPLKGIDRNTLTPEERAMLLDDIQHLYAPTKIGIDIAHDLQNMIRSSLRARNPLLAEARIKHNQMLAALSDEKSLLKIPWFNTPLHAKMIWGVTGLGKTHAVVRFLNMIQPSYVHGEDKCPGMNKLTQIVWLYIKMTHDGYRGGFLLAILIAVDELCGSDYSKRFKNEKVEILAVRVGHILVCHFVGLLVIDDINVKNFALSPERDAMLLLFLKLLDFGIAVVLIGNPLAFLDIASFSQDHRRLTAREPQELMPYETLKIQDWGEGLIPSFWGHNVMEVQTPLTPDIKETIHYESAGFTHYGRLINFGVQDFSIKKGLKQVTDQALKDYVKQSATLASAQTLLKGFRDKDPYLLSAVEDVPWQEYGVRWGKIKPEEIIDPVDSTKGEKTSRRRKLSREDRILNLQARAARSYLADKARREQKNEANASAGNGHPPEDLRNEGIDQVHVEGLRKMREEASKSI